MRNPRIWPWIGRDLAALCILLLIALAAGLAINRARDNPLPLVYSSKAARLEHSVQTIAGDSTKPAPPADVPTLNAGLTNVSLEEFKRSVEGGAFIILDARPEILYRLGHVPGALSLPRNDFEAAYARLKSQLEKDRGRPIVVYCSDADCEDSELVGNALLQLDYRQVSRFKGGWADWTNAHLPEEKSP